MRQGLQSVLLCLLMVFGSLSGCFGPDEEEESGGGSQGDEDEDEDETGEE